MAHKHAMPVGGPLGHHNHTVHCASRPRRYFAHAGYAIAAQLARAGEGLLFLRYRQGGLAQLPDLPDPGRIDGI